MKLHEMRDELRQLREPPPDPDMHARFDVEAGVAREVGEARFVASACGPMEPDFDPTEDLEHQMMAARLSELRPGVAELRRDVLRDESVVDGLPAHPVFWYLLLGLAVIVETACGIQLFQAMGMSEFVRPLAALALMSVTFLVVWLVRNTSARAEDVTGWRRALAWAKFGLVALCAAGVAICIGFSRTDPNAGFGLPIAVRSSRLVLLVLITVGPAIVFKFAIDQLARSRGPRSELRSHRRELKRAERELLTLTRDIAEVRRRAASWRARASSHRARYQAAFDRANRRPTGGARAPVSFDAAPRPADNTDKGRPERRAARRDDAFQD